MKKVIKLVGDVGGYDNAYNRILDGTWLESELAGLTEEDEVEFIIHSFGGSVFEGQYMYNLLKKCPAKKIAHVYGSCMSMATILSMACDKVYMCENSMYMVHKASGGGYGNEKDIESVLSALKGVDSIAINTYSKRTKLTKEKLISEFMTGYDKWLTPTEALEFGFIDEIKDPIQEVIQSDNYSNYDFGFDVYFHNAKDVEMKERPLILNQFINKPSMKMENVKDKEKEKVETILNDSEPSKIISQLQNAANNFKKEIADKDTVISNLEIERDEVKAQLETIQNEAAEKIAKFERAANEAKELVATKENLLQRQKIENAVNLAVSNMRITYPLLNDSQSEQLATDFINRHSVAISNDVTTVVDRISNQNVSDSIQSAVTHFAITTNYVQATKVGFGRSASANLSSNDVSNSYQKQQEEQENKQIEHYSKDLQKQGIGKGGKDWCLAMLDKFPNSEKAVPKVLKEKFNLK
jgi:ATP-dependent protease ClpP protease subunit